MLNTKQSRWLILSLFIVVLDQLSKYFVRTHLVLGRPFHVFSWLNFTLAYNKGMAFSFLANQPGWQLVFLSGVSLVVGVAVMIWLLRLPTDIKWRALALALIVGGAFGNFFDRAFLGQVTDFIDFHIASWHFATFNVADSAVSVGAALLIWEAIFKKSS